MPETVRRSNRMGSRRLRVNINEITFFFKFIGSCERMISVRLT